ncbi:hypothetical protein ACS0TY_007019 [Phlomoides rotata]
MEFNTTHFITNVFGKYPRLWALRVEGPIDVRRWYNFGALTSIRTITPCLKEISELPDWVGNAVQESWYTNPHLKRGDELEIKFITVASEDMTNSICYLSFHFMKLQRPDHRSANYIKHQETKPELVVNLTEDENSVNGSFLLNTMAGNITRFANDVFKQKRAMIWENKLIGTENTRRKACNMMHVERWHERICQFCATQEKPLFGRNFSVKRDRPGKELRKKGMNFLGNRQGP